MTTAEISLFIGIDDTDNLESRGTGFRVRELAREMRERGLADTKSITRHQLFVSPDIPYTSHNSSACLRVRTEAGKRRHEKHAPVIGDTGCEFIDLAR